MSGGSAQEVRLPKKPSGTITSAGLAALVDPLFAQGMAEERIPGAAFVLVQDGRIVLAKGFGHADVASGRAVSPDETIFPIASISKVFTATAVMQLADRGRIDLKADVNRYLTSVQVPLTYPQPVTAERPLVREVAVEDGTPHDRGVVGECRFRAGGFARWHFQPGTGQDLPRCQVFDRRLEEKGIGAASP